MAFPRSLILLVGSNPLPNLLTARALRPEKIAMVYTRETESMKNRLQRLLAKEFDFVQNDSFLKDSNSADEVRRCVEPLMDPPDGVHLNYTGGTKVMAAHARMAFRDAGGKMENASYLDEGGSKRRPRLRFDDGNILPLTEFPGLTVSLEEVLALHDIRYAPREAVEPAPTLEDARTILQAVFQDIDDGLNPPKWRTKLLHEEHRRLKKLKTPKRASEAPFLPAKSNLNLSLSNLPDSKGMDESAFKHWHHFIGGQWLEEWLAEEIRNIGLEPTPIITVGLNSFRGKEAAWGRKGKGRQFEIDVAVFRNFRTYFISCTTDTTMRLCKSKLFEIAIRSRHLGGDLARAALVCMANEETLGELEQDIGDLWEAGNPTQVFGLNDIRQWAGADGTPPNRTSLQSWLES